MSCLKGVQRLRFAHIAHVTWIIIFQFKNPCQLDSMVEEEPASTSITSTTTSSIATTGTTSTSSTIISTSKDITTFSPR